MKIIMYGAESCPDCIAAKGTLDSDVLIELDYRDITKNLKILKEFLAYRDKDKMFEQVIKDGYIGIPFFILEDETKTFEVSKVSSKEHSVKPINTCSIDGKGC